MAHRWKNCSQSPKKTKRIIFYRFSATHSHFFASSSKQRPSSLVITALGCEHLIIKRKPEEPITCL